MASQPPARDSQPTPNSPSSPSPAEPNTGEARRTTVPGVVPLDDAASSKQRHITYAGVPAGLAKYGLGAWYLIGIGLVVAFVVFATAHIQMVFTAVFVALVITSLLSPMVGWLSRRMPRAAATAISLVATFIFFGGLLFYIGYSVSTEWNDLSAKFSHGLDQIFDFVSKTPFGGSFENKELNEDLQDVMATVMKWIQDNAGSLATQAMSSASTMALFFTMFALAIFVAIFFLTSGKKMWLWFINLVPAKNRINLHRSAIAGWATFSGYARGTIIISVTDGVLAGILLIILGIPLAAPLAVLVMIGAVIPLVGAPAAMIIAMIVALAADGLAKAAFVGIGIALIGQFEGHILQPLVMGRKVSLHPVVVAIGVAAGTFLAGLLGAIIAIPLIAVIWEVHNVLRHPDPPFTLEQLDAIERVELQREREEAAQAATVREKAKRARKKTETRAKKRLN
ncbi:MAG: AI-2E family transporter [Ancrocorticia sp.]|jgi:predicted PurR-regulated permease PerM|nr:AI-2E family transporter [Ancrocorticia sp.]MCI1896167.1 AI-2E family transporter [Ancrocorticia sp.]MCI2179105.1 AI-2E family transporter [Ancrocorticia sp.]